MTAKTKTALGTEITTNFPDNTIGAITPAIMRTTTQDFVDSWQQAPQVNAQTGTTYTILVGDYGKLVTFNNSSAVAVTLPQATSSFSVFNFYAKNLGAGTVTITPTTSTINGALNYALQSGASVFIVSDGTNWQVSLSAPSSEIDIFLLIGSSNTVGQGTAASSPTVPPGMVLRYAYDGTIADANDPMKSAVDANVLKNSQTGSMWPSFGIAYGRRVGIVLTAVSGSTQSAAADFLAGAGNWQDTTPGSNYALALAAINAALTAFVTAGYTPTFKGIIQTDLGTNDAAQIDAGVIVVAQYTAAYNAMAANWRAATIGGKTYPHMPIYMSLVGTNTNVLFPDSPGYFQVRNAQYAIVAADGNTLLPFVNTPSFAGRGLIQASSVHPTQAGYNEWGTWLGGSTVPYVQGTVPYLVLSQNATNAPLPLTGTIFQLAGQDAVGPNILFDSFGTNLAAQVILRTAVGTNAVPTALASGQNIGIYGVRGYGSTAFGSKNVGSIVFQTSQVWTDANQGTAINFFNTPNGSNTPASCMFIDQDKTVKMPAYGLGVLHSSAAGLLSSSAVVLTSEVSGVLPLANGGTNNTITASNGGVVWSDASKLNVLSGTATANQMLVSGASATPAWSTNTHPVTNAQGDLIYGSASNVLSTLAKSATATRYLANTGTSNNPAWDQVNLTNGVTGTLPIANGGTGVATGSVSQVSAVTSVTFDVAGDYAISIPLPSGFTQITNVQLIISNASGDLSAANFGLFTATGGGGTALLAAATAITVTTAAANTVNNLQLTNVSNVNTEAYTPVSGQLQFRVGNLAPAGRTGKVYVRYIPVP